MKRILKLVAALVLCLTAVLPGNAAAATASIPYINASGAAQTPRKCVLITADRPTTDLQDDWYAVQGNVTIPGSMHVSGNVNLILCDGCTLNVKNGIVVYRSASLSVWAQSSGNSKGKLIATGGENAAGIGGTLDYDAGNIYINGGDITATGGNEGAGIGGGSSDHNKASSLNIQINGGKVTATGGRYGSGIGSGRGQANGDIEITGGTVVATGSLGGAGIGGGGKGSQGTISISGGNVTASGGSNEGAGIGGSSAFNGGNVTITGGSVTATGGTGGGAGIGGGCGPNGGNLVGVVTISGGTVTATGNGGGAGIGGGEAGNAKDGRVKISGGTVTATGSDGAAGIGGGTERVGWGGEGATVEITGGTVTAKSGEGSSSAIGHGDDDEYYGTVTFADNMMVSAGWSVDDCVPFSAAERQVACQYRWYARVETCAHSSPTYDIFPEYHQRTCNYCNTVFPKEEHVYPEGQSVCGVCGHGFGPVAVVYVLNNGQDHVVKWLDANIVHHLPAAEEIVPPEGKILTGWQRLGDEPGAGAIMPPGAPFNAGLVQSMTFSAVWADKITITFDGDDHIIIVDDDGLYVERYSQNAAKGSIYTIPNLQTNWINEDSGKAILGWYQEDSSRIRQAGDSFTATKDMTLTAIWDLCTVSFDSAGGSAVPAQSIVNHRKVTAPADPVRPGFIFLGWDTDFSNVTTDLTVTALWKQEIVTHQVVFKDGLGNVLDTQTVVDGRPAAAPRVPARPGFVFSGWDTDFSSVTADLNVKALWTKASPEENRHTVVFVFGFGLAPVPQTVGHGGSASAPRVPEVDGFTFAGWDREFTNVTDNLTITAQWKKHSAGKAHTVVFTDGYSSNPLLIQRVGDGQSATPPEVPAREGYTFIGWDTDFSYVTEDMTVIAQWKQNIEIYTVAFTDGLGTTLKTEAVASGGSATPPAAPARDGYTFDGWDTDFSSVRSDLTVTARWKQAVVTRRVTFEDGMGNVLDTQTVVYGRPAAAPADPARDGFLFSGWDTDFSSVTTDLTVRARWTENSREEGRHTVVFVFGAGLDPVPQTVEQGGAAAAPAVPQLDGYTFAGWDKEFTNVTDHLTVTALWKKNAAEKAHTVVFVDGYSYNPLLIQRVGDGESAAPPEAPAREGYTFTGWDTDFSYVTEDMTVIAQWKQNTEPAPGPQPEPEPQPEPVPIDKLEEFVRRCYRTLLGREADAAGLKTWTDQMASGNLSAAEVLQGFVSSDEFRAKNLDQAATLDIVGRMMAALTEEVKKYTEDVQKGKSIAYVINSLSASNEFDRVRNEYDIRSDFGNENGVRTDIIRVRAFVTRCYQTLLGREPDGNGMNNWAEALASGKLTAAQVVMGFLDSEEFIARGLSSEAVVSVLYQTMLDRTPDETGKSQWIPMLDGGKPLSAVVDGLCGSDEFRKICEECGVNPGKASSGSAPGQQEPQPEPQWNEDRVREFIARCYRKGLNREADAEGMEHWTGLIMSGKHTPATAAQAILSSGEMQSRNLGNEEFVRVLYAVFLDRDAGTEELASWTGRMDREQPESRSSILKGFADSTEFKKIQESMKKN